ncbi:MAG: tetratricopeptide repeat protein [Candidatus Latescibacterota bacterium]
MNLPVRFAFLLVFLVALLLRWPLPEPAWLQVDERSFVEFPLGFFGGDLNPHFFNYPTLHFYLCAALDYVWFLLSDSDSLENFVAYRWFVDGFDIIVLARALSTVMSVATVVVVWRIGLRLYGPVAGLGAALFLALMPLHVRFAHLAATDSPAVLWVSLSLLYAVCIVQEGRLRDCLCAGLFVGLAGATKYPGALVAIPVGMSALLRWPTWRNPGLVLAAAASLLTFAVTSPYTWLDPGAFWTGLSQMGREHLLSDMHADGEGRGVTVLRVNLRYGFGLMSLALGVVAILWPWRWRRDDLVLLAAIILFGTLVLSASSLFMRYCLPLAPLWSVLVWRLLHRLEARRVWQLGCVALVLAEPAWGSWQHRRLHGGPDTRTEAIAWTLEHLPSGGRLVQMQGRAGQTRRLFTPVSVMVRLQPFERVFGLERLIRAFEILHQRQDLPALYTYYDLNALPRSTAKTSAETLDSTLVLWYEHPLRPNDDEPALAPVLDRIDWLASFSPGPMPEAVFDQVDWHFVPIGGWRDVHATGPSIRVGRAPLNFRTPVPSNRQFLKLMHDIQAGRLAARQQDWAGARRHLGAVLQTPYHLEELLTPSVRYDVLLKLGVAGFYLGDHRAAIDRWHHAAQLKPEMAEPHYNMGLAYEALERHAEAVARYERAAALQPDNADILYSLAQSHARLGRYVEAIAAYGSAVQLAPSAEGYADFGRILQISGRPEEAKAAFEQSLRLTPDHTRAADIRLMLRR